MVSGSTTGRLPDFMPLLLIAWFPAVAWGASVSVFPLAFSSLGRRERTELPEEPPVHTVASTWGRVGWFWATAPFVTWRVYRDGLGVSIFGLGDAFVRRKEILDVDTRHSSNRVVHRSKEIRRPLRVPRGVADALERPETFERGGRSPARTEFRRAWVAVGLAALFLTATSAFMFIHNTRVRSAREEILGFLERAGPRARVEVCDSKWGWEGRSGAGLLAAFRDVEGRGGGSARPTRRFSVTLLDGDEALRLELARDRKDEWEYMVFVPRRGWPTDLNAIGRIRTDLLDHIRFARGFRGPTR